MFSIGVVFQNGKKWEKIRRLVLTSMRSFGMGRPEMEQRVLDEVDEVINGLTKEEGKSVCLKQIFHKTVCNVMCSVLFGRRCVKI